jgi:hypothetical protein
MYVNWEKFIWFIVCLVMIIYGLVKGIPAFWLVKKEVKSIGGTVLPKSIRYTRFHFITLFYEEFYTFTIGGMRYTGKHFHGRNDSKLSPGDTVQVTYLVSNPKINSIMHDEVHIRNESFVITACSVVLALFLSFSTFSFIPQNRNIDLKNVSSPWTTDNYVYGNLDAVIPWYVEDVYSYDQALLIRVDDIRDAAANKDFLLGGLTKPLYELVRETVSINSVLLVQLPNGKVTVYSAERLAHSASVRNWFKEHHVTLKDTIETPIAPYYSSKTSDIRKSLAGAYSDTQQDTFIYRPGNENENSDVWTKESFMELANSTDKDLPPEYHCGTLDSLYAESKGKSIMIDRGIKSQFGISANEFADLHCLISQIYPLINEIKAAGDNEALAQEKKSQLLTAIYDKDCFIYRNSTDDTMLELSEVPDNGHDAVFVYLLEPSYAGSPGSDIADGYEIEKMQCAAAIKEILSAQKNIFLCSGNGSEHLVYLSYDSMSKLMALKDMQY